MKSPFALILTVLTLTTFLASQAHALSSNNVTGISLNTTYKDTISGPQEFRGFGESFQVAEGQVVEVLSQKFGLGNSFQANVSVSLELRGTLPSGVEFILFTGDIIAGPATITTSYVVRSSLSQGVEAIIDFNAFASLAVSSPNSSPFVSNSAVVIPEDATGPVEIILESSTDLINWALANPGTYGASTEQRFFRLRAVVSD